MGRRTVLVVALALIAIGVIGMAITLVSQGTYGDARPVPARVGGMDAMFIAAMIPHHEDAIAMADLALTRAEHPELKQLAERIKATQTAENAQMRAWYRQWFGGEVPTSSDAFGMMGGMMGARTTDLEALRAADSFDKAFLEAMIPHHQMGVMMSRMAGSATSRPEMRAFTQAIIDGQSREIEQMEEWYGEWFGR
jgi:uncharacterized protein (DUF305 family)